MHVGAQPQNSVIVDNSTVSVTSLILISHLHSSTKERYIRSEAEVPNPLHLQSICPKRSTHLEMQLPLYMGFSI